MGTANAVIVDIDKVASNEVQKMGAVFIQFLPV
jgi:hypothetical protein